MAITIDDFSKIWASTSPLTPYEFSENNYKQGWDFIGATPPSRQMWDFLQKNNDEKMQYLANNYLPLSGGTMSGAIIGNPLTLTADDGNGNSVDLVANADGSLTWNGTNVALNGVTTGKFTVLNGTADPNYLERHGDWVQAVADMGGITGTVANTWNDILQLPSGFLPKYAFDFAGINNGSSTAIQTKITSAGIVRVWGSIARFRMQVVYLAGD